MKKLSLTVVGLACAFAMFASVASASTDAILKDCNDDGALSGNYSKSDLQGALANIPADLKQYSSCESIINAALLKKITKPSGGGGSGGKGGSSSAKTASVDELTTPAQRRKIRKSVEQATSLSPGAPIAAAEGVGGIKKASGQTLASDSAPGVPTALIVAVLGLLLMFGVDLAGRLGKIPRVTKFLPKTGRRGDS
jgi:hypothetical protein